MATLNPHSARCTIDDTAPADGDGADRRRPRATAVRSAAAPPCPGAPPRHVAYALALATVSALAARQLGGRRTGRRGHGDPRSCRVGRRRRRPRHRGLRRRRRPRWRTPSSWASWPRAGRSATRSRPRRSPRRSQAEQAAAAARPRPRPRPPQARRPLRPRLPPRLLQRPRPRPRPPPARRRLDGRHRHREDQQQRRRRAAAGPGRRRRGRLQRARRRRHHHRRHPRQRRRPGRPPVGAGAGLHVCDAALGDAIVEYHIAHWDELGVEYIIWQQRMLSSPGGSWKAMADRGSATANHMDHVARELPGMSDRTPAPATCAPSCSTWTARSWRPSSTGARRWTSSPPARRADVRGGAQPHGRHQHADVDGDPARGPRLTRTEERVERRRPLGRGPDGAAMAAGIEWRPGARELVAAVRDAGLATALVTTTPRRLAEIVLGSIRADLGGRPVRRDRLRGRGAGAQAGPGALPAGDGRARRRAGRSAW